MLISAESLTVWLTASLEVPPTTVIGAEEAGKGDADVVALAAVADKPTQHRVLDGRSTHELNRLRNVVQREATRGATNAPVNSFCDTSRKSSSVGRDSDDGSVPPSVLFEMRRS
jgi:hypothetical protein